MQHRYSWNIYSRLAYGSTSWPQYPSLETFYAGEVIDRTNGQRVFKTRRYLTEDDAIHACLDAIDTLIAEGE